MLTIHIPLREGFDEAKSEFVVLESFELELEHSLVSLSKWESFYEKPFLSTKEKTSEETLYYVKAMTLTKKVPPEIYGKLTRSNVDDILAHIDKKMTATTFASSENQKPNREVITSELIYYWMIAYNIPHVYEEWHLNRLLTLIQVCGVKNAPKKKVANREMLEQRRALNEMRKAQMGTNG